MNAEIIAIGSELTCGARLDTNSQWLSRELEAIGWTVTRHTTVADDHDAMVRIFQDAASRSAIVLVTGGLGPTLDDITRDTLAAAFDQPLVMDEEALAHIEKLFRSRNREMPERNRVQAQRPANAHMITNAHGTAPGILLKVGEPECLIAVMPGVPAEMRLMFREQIQPLLPKSQITVKRTLIRTFGMGESEAERRLGDLTARGRNPEVGITASEAVITLSITARASSEDACDDLTAVARDRIYEALGTAIFGEEDAELHEAVVQQLTAQQKKIALLEGATTGGILSQWLTESEEGQAALVVSQLYSSEATLLAKSPLDTNNWQDACRHLARQFLQDADVDYVLISSPSSQKRDAAGIASKHGSVLVIGPDLEQEQDVSMAGNLAIFRQRASRTALNILRLHLLDD